MNTKAFVVVTHVLFGIAGSLRIDCEGVVTPKTDVTRFIEHACRPRLSMTVKR